MKAIKTFMWIQNSNSTLPDYYIINNKVIDASEDILRKKAASLLLLDIYPNFVERQKVQDYIADRNQQLEMKSSISKGTIYISQFVEERVKGEKLNFFYWCATSELPNLYKLLLRDASLIGKHIDPQEVQFIKSTTKAVIAYRLLFIIFGIISLLLIIKFI